MSYCLITAMRDVAGFVPPFRRMVDSFSVRPAIILVGENDSSDATPDLLRDWGAARTISFCTDVPRFDRVATAERSAHLAAVRNRLIDEALRYPWDWALFQDAQKHVGPGTPTFLEPREGTDILAPAVRNPGGIFYDTWCFRHLDGSVLLRANSASGRTEVGSVGGVFSVRREVLEAGCRFVGGGEGACDSVGLCAAARRRGYRVWMDADAVATHCRRPELMERLLAKHVADSLSGNRPGLECGS